MGYDSLEFLKRGVRVTATDLTENAVRLARRHFEIENVAPESVHTENALALSFPDDTFDAVWSNGVLHATGDTRLAIQEARRVLKPGGRAIISHFYRKPSWMYTVSVWAASRSSTAVEDPPVNEFYTDEEILDFLRGLSGRRSCARASPRACRWRRAASRQACTPTASGRFTTSCQSRWR